MPTSTTRLGLTIPVAADPPLIPANELTLGDQLDALINGFFSGTAANRGTVVTSPSAGMIYLATDTGETTMYNGTAWFDIGPAITLLALQARGDLLMASGVGAVQRLAVGNAGQNVGVSAGLPAWETVPGRILGEADYNPATGVQYTIGNGSPASIDSTNLAVTFAAPPSGAVLVSFSIFSSLSGGASAGSILSSVWDVNAGSEVAAAYRQLQYQNTEDASSTFLSTWERINHRTRITGLTPGTSYKYAAAAAWTANAGWCWAGGANGVAHMEVLAA